MVQQQRKYVQIRNIPRWGGRKHQPYGSHRRNGCGHRQRTWLEQPALPADSYIPRIFNWTADEGTLAVVHLTRNQRELPPVFLRCRQR